jgi:putative RecB family exonuclease
MKYEGAITYSRLRDFEQCGLLFQLRHIEKRSEPSSPHFVKGSRVHDALEQFLKGRVRTLPPESEPLALQLVALKKDKSLIGEQAWGYDEDWAPLPVTGYFSKADHVRAKVDAMTTAKNQARIIDFKTGKIRPTDVDQVRFYALLAMLRYHEITSSLLTLWYVEQGKIEDFKAVPRSDVPTILASFKKRIAKMMGTEKFKPTPGLHCRWCAFSRHKGGPCQY